MLQRLYVHNFRCLENFEFKPDGATSALLIGRNGSGKSTVARVLQLLQHIGRGVNRVGQLVRPSEFTQARSETPMRFELDVVLGKHSFQYQLALELPARFRELRVLKESLSVDGAAVFARHEAEVGPELRVVDQTGEIGDGGLVVRDAYGVVDEIRGRRNGLVRGLLRRRHLDHSAFHHRRDEVDR